MRQCKNHMRVRNWQSLFGVCGQPAVARHTAALRAMPVQARVIDKRFALASIACIQVSAELRGSTCADITESLELAVRQQGSPAFQKLLFMLTKDIGDFQPMLAHLCL